MKDFVKVTLVGGDERDQKRFEILHFVWRLTFIKFSRTAEGLRACNRIGDKLEEVSNHQPTSQDALARQLIRGSNQIVFSAHDAMKLRQMLTDEEIGWPFAMGKAAEECQDWSRTDAWQPAEAETK